jgi:myo-inositol-1(or 4)-monophosphatase
MVQKARERALAVTVQAALATGRLLRQELRSAKTVDARLEHDIKLELDVRCQRLIERRLLAAFPESAILGEEGVVGRAEATLRWVVDPIDGTVNYSYGIPHACVSIALQERVLSTKGPARRPPGADWKLFETLIGVVYDPFRQELWTALRGQPPQLNGQAIRVSERKRLADAIISLGFGKRAEMLNYMIPAFTQLVHRVRKMRMMGAAALDLCYVAMGRFDAFAETGLRLWDIAAGGFILECAGGEYWRRPMPGEHVYELLASNGRLRRALRHFIPAQGALPRT